VAESLIFAFSNPIDGKDDEFNQWYDDQHLGEVLDVPGVLAARRYDLVPTKAQKGDDSAERPHRYLTIYELDSDPKVVLKELGARIGAGKFSTSDAIDMSTTSFVVWRARGERRISP
jgi:hypothetical protein